MLLFELGTVESDVHTFRSADRPVHWRLPSCPRCSRRGLRELIERGFIKERSRTFERKLNLVEFDDLDDRSIFCQFGDTDNPIAGFGLDSRSTRSAFNR